jgi:hypothetical protein
VDRVANYLSQILNERGAGLDPTLIVAASLLHDITKMDGLRTGLNHAQTGGAFLRSLGYPRVAEVVECHIDVPRDPTLLKITEEEVVNYSDKRVMHDRIVTLEERFDDLKTRYGKNPQSLTLIDASLESAKEIEAKIFRHLSFHPGELALKLPRCPLHEE